MVVIDSTSAKYSFYSIPNDEIIKQLGMIKHIEGGEYIPKH